jgi:hypothetical protein
MLSPFAQNPPKISIMKKPAEFHLSIGDIDTYDLEAIEEKLLYIRYLIRREQKEYKLLKFHYVIESLERRKEVLRTRENNSRDTGVEPPQQ